MRSFWSDLRNGDGWPAKGAKRRETIHFNNTPLTRRVNTSILGLLLFSRIFALFAGPTRAFSKEQRARNGSVSNPRCVFGGFGERQRNGWQGIGLRNIPLPSIPLPLFGTHRETNASRTFSPSTLSQRASQEDDVIPIISTSWTLIVFITTLLPFIVTPIAFIMPLLPFIATLIAFITPLLPFFWTLTPFP